MSDLWTKKTFILDEFGFCQSTFDCIRVDLILKLIIKAALPLSASRVMLNQP